MPPSSAAKSQTTTGTLQIGDQWNAINIIAHSQTHPLKAICELTENAIDAGATHVHILRRRHKGDVYLEVLDNGRGVAPDEDGNPDFLRIATHLCDSMKRHLDAQHRRGVHGEFGIGLLSFWSLGSELRMIAGGPTGVLHELELTRGGRTYTIRPVRGQLPTGGTRVIVGPLLEATKKLVTGEKVARYLSAELRDRIRKTGVKIEVVDRVSRSEQLVTPREFDGDRLEIPRRCKTPLGDVHVELYMRCESSQPDAAIALCKDGTRVLRDVCELLPFQHAPWCDGRLEGLLDFDPLTLAPGTRSGIVADDAFDVPLLSRLRVRAVRRLAQRRRGDHRQPVVLTPPGTAAEVADLDHRRSTVFVDLVGHPPDPWDDLVGVGMQVSERRWAVRRHHRGARCHGHRQATLGLLDVVGPVPVLRHAVLGVRGFVRRADHTVLQAQPPEVERCEERVVGRHGQYHWSGRSALRRATNSQSASSTAASIGGASYDSSVDRHMA
jgi:hypothetical protein